MSDLKKITDFLFHPLIAALLVTVFLFKKFRLAENPSKMILIYFSVAVIMWFFNRSNKMYDWNPPGGLFGSEGVFSTNGE